MESVEVSSLNTEQINLTKTGLNLTKTGLNFHFCYNNPCFFHFTYQFQLPNWKTSKEKIFNGNTYLSVIPNFTYKIRDKNLAYNYNIVTK